MRSIAVALACLAAAAALEAQELGLEAEVRRRVAELGAPEDDRRRAAEDGLVALGEAALPFLPDSDADPERDWRLSRVRHRIRWNLGRPILDAVGGLLDDFDALPFRRRIDRLHDLVRLGGREGLPVLIAIAARDPHEEVRSVARRLAGEVDLVLRIERAQPALAGGRWDDAIRIVSESLRIDPDGAAIHYQIACYFSMAGRLDEGFAALERAVELGFTNFTHMEEDPELDALRGDPRFEALRQRHEDRSR